MSAPSTPTNLTLYQDNNAALATWSTVSGATGGYLLTRDSTLISNTTNSSYTDTGVVNNEKHQYAVAAWNNTGTSSFSANVTSGAYQFVTASAIPNSTGTKVVVTFSDAITTSNNATHGSTGYAMNLFTNATASSWDLALGGLSITLNLSGAITWQDIDLNPSPYISFTTAGSMQSYVNGTPLATLAPQVVAGPRPSLVGLGGVSSVSGTLNALTPATLSDFRNGFDGQPCNIYSITNLDTSNYFQPLINGIKTKPVAPTLTEPYQYSLGGNDIFRVQGYGQDVNGGTISSMTIAAGWTGRRG